jgi:hypothetical protein
MGHKVLKENKSRIIIILFYKLFYIINIRMIYYWDLLLNSVTSWRSIHESNNFNYKILMPPSKLPLTYFSNVKTKERESI